MDEPVEKILNGGGGRRLGRASERFAGGTRGLVSTLRKIWYDAWGFVANFVYLLGRPNSS